MTIENPGCRHSPRSPSCKSTPLPSSCSYTPPIQSSKRLVTKQKARDAARGRTPLPELACMSLRQTTIHSPQVFERRRDLLQNHLGGMCARRPRKRERSDESCILANDAGFIEFSEMFEFASLNTWECWRSIRRVLVQFYGTNGHVYVPANGVDCRKPRLPTLSMLSLTQIYTTPLLLFVYTSYPAFKAVGNKTRGLRRRTCPNV